MPHPCKPLRRALLVFTVLGFAACEGGNALIDNAASDPAVTEVNGVKLVQMAPGRVLAPAGDAVMVNAKQGATIENGDARLTVLPGSIPANTKITMEPRNNGYVEFVFGPSGLQFSPNATLTISAAKANLDVSSKHRLRIAVASDGANDWQMVGGTYDPATDTVTVPIEHFSRYALCID